MDYLLMVLAIIALIVGFVGDVLPVIPGPAVTYLSLLLLHWTERFDYRNYEFLVIVFLICVVITMLDYVVPAWGTKKFGGTKQGTWGSIIGLLVSVIGLPILGISIGPFGLFGLLAGPFFGAYFGEKIAKTPEKDAWRAALGSFIGFLAGTMMKITFTIVISVYVIKDIIVGFSEMM
jgi:hypothetical protein